MNILRKYFDSLNITSPEITLEGITQIIKHHLEKFPFTSIPVLLGFDLQLDIDFLINKLIVQGKGGYCFEHNKLLYNAMKYLNLNVTPLLARVIMNKKTIPPKTHRITILEYSGERYLLDVGNSYYSLPLPVNLNGTEAITQLGQTYRIAKKSPDIYELQYIQKKSIFIIYQFTFQKCYEVDFELSHFYSHKHPKATFVNNMVISKVFQDEIRSLRNNTYYKIFSQNASQSAIKDIHHFREILTNDFEYILSDTETEYLYNKFILTHT